MNEKLRSCQCCRV